MRLGEKMTEKQVAELIRTQKNCFLRSCNHNCSRCNLERDVKDVVRAYDYVLDFLSEQKETKREFFNSGIEYAKSEFARFIDSEKDKLSEQHKNSEINDMAYMQCLGLQKALETIDKIVYR